jgi:Uma2 family endonuclease
MVSWQRVEQTDPPRSPRETLPTMYDLPSEFPDEPGLPDEFHALQPQLLSATLRLSGYSAENYFTGMDLNVYYHVRHPLWHKRPDWFLALGVPRLYDGHDLRLSYVAWQEGANPFVVVELLSPGTEAEDLGQRKGSSRPADQPPSKWEVYEQILRVPYYFLFDRYENRFRGFGLNHSRYQPLDIEQQKIWLPELNLGLGVWQGTYQGVTRPWLRWYDVAGQWIPTPAELNQQERQRAEQAEQQVYQIARNLAQTGMAIADIATITGLSAEQVRSLLEA